MTTVENNMESEEKGYEGVQTPLRRFLSDFCEAKLAVVGFFTILAIALLAIMAPFIAQQIHMTLPQLVCWIAG